MGYRGLKSRLPLRWHPSSGGGTVTWQVEDMETFMFFGTKKGLVLTIPVTAKEEGLTQVVVLALTGSPVAGSRGDMANECGLYVQVWHAP